MPTFDLVVETKASRTRRCRQLEAMFDVPPTEKLRHEWHVDAPVEGWDWRIGLIVGPSGSGKTQIARRMFGGATESSLRWTDRAVIDDFAMAFSMEQIAAVCSAVGFNTIPSWMKPFAVLSNGEKFRVELARRLLEGGDLVVVDEFSSVVDRQVAKIAAHAVQKFVRKGESRRFVAVTCHYDVVDWLQPDWTYDPSTRIFARGRLRRRPELSCCVGPVSRAAWRIFAPFHYLSADLHRAARCWGLWCVGRLAAFAGMLHRPQTAAGRRKHPGGVMGVSRLVTLPDFQGMGLGMALLDRVASVYAAIDKTVRMYPAHPALSRTLDRSPTWALEKRPGLIQARSRSRQVGKLGMRPNAVFRYIGPSCDPVVADRLLSCFSA